MASLAERRSRLHAATYATFGEEAAWTPVAGGGPLPVSVRRREGDEEGRFGRSEAVLPTTFIAVRRSEIAAPAKGDLVAIGADTFKIIAAPQLAARGTQWRCEAVQVPAP